jgi:hypothetical protein
MKYKFLALLTSVLCYWGNAQVPFALWDFETNTNRSNLESNIESVIAGVGTPGITASGVTLASGSGNGSNYGGSISGTATGYFNWTTNANTNPTTDPYLIFGPFTGIGFSNITVKFDVMGVGLKAPDNIDVYYSTNGVNYTKVVASNSVTSSWNTLSFTLPAAANSVTSLYIKLVGYNASAAASGTDGALRLDNFTMYAATVSGNKTLISAVAHGAALSSGGTHLPTYDNLTLGGNITTPANITFSGTLSLGANNFIVGDNTLTFHTSSTPITRTNGRITMGTGGTIAFGATGFTSGASFAIPTNMFSGGGTVIFKSLVINKDNTVTLGTQNITLTGDLAVAKGILNLNGTVLTTSGNVTGNGIISGAGASLVKMQGLNKTIGTFTISNLQLTNTGNYTMTGNLTISNTLTLSAGTLAVGSNTLSFHTGNTPIVLTAGAKINLTSASSLSFGTSGFNAGNAFVIPNNLFTSTPCPIKNFSINRTNAITLNNQNFDLTGVLAVTAGTLNLPVNYLFTLKSTSVTNTALVDKVGGTINYGTGAAFLVERFFPNTLPTSKKSFRDISPGVTSTTTIFQNWQENGINNNGYGTQITGSQSGIGGVNPVNGFDNTQTGSKSMRFYLVQPVGAPVWTNASSTNQPNDILLGYKPYRIFIRGNRMNDLYANPAPYTMNAAATLRSRGKLITGTVTVTETGTIVGTAPADNRVLMNKLPNGFTMIANPYAAPIDWISLKANNPSVVSYYLVVDPLLGTSSQPGAYVSYSTLLGSNNMSSAVSRYIQPGQSFFVKNGATGPFSFKITEADKVVSQSVLSNVWKKGLTNGKAAETMSKLDFTLTVTENNVLSTLDGTRIVFDEGFSAAVSEFDVPKATNQFENVAVKKQSSLLNIATSPTPLVTDTFKLRVWQIAPNTAYTLNINTSEFTDGNLRCYIKDRLTGTEHLLASSAITAIVFTPSSDTMSYMERFKLFFRSGVALPSSFISASAYRTSEKIKVDWTVNQINTNRYILFRSNDGKNFFKVDSVVANKESISAYSFYDRYTTEKIYYQITAMDNDGSVIKSSVLSVKNELTTATISLHPNPIENRIIHLRLNKLAAGTYTLRLMNEEGKSIAEKQMNHTSQSFFTWQLPQHISTGAYRVQIIGVNFQETISCIIK